VPASPTTTPQSSRSFPPDGDSFYSAEAAPTPASAFTSRHGDWQSATAANRNAPPPHLPALALHLTLNTHYFGVPVAPSPLPQALRTSSVAAGPPVARHPLGHSLHCLPATFEKNPPQISKKLLTTRRRRLPPITMPIAPSSWNTTHAISASSTSSHRSSSSHLLVSQRCASSNQRFYLPDADCLSSSSRTPLFASSGLFVTPPLSRIPSSRNPPRAQHSPGDSLFPLLRRTQHSLFTLSTLPSHPVTGAIRMPHEQQRPNLMPRSHSPRRSNPILSSPSDSLPAERHLRIITNLLRTRPTSLPHGPDLLQPSEPLEPAHTSRSPPSTSHFTFPSSPTRSLDPTRDHSSLLHTD